MGVISIYRAVDVGLLRRCRIYVNGELVARIWPGQTKTLTAPDGVVSVQVYLDWLCSNLWTGMAGVEPLRLRFEADNVRRRRSPEQRDAFLLREVHEAD